MRRIPIRLKLASALALPLVALAIVSALELREASRWVAELNRQADLARSSIGPSGLLRSLQNERAWPSVELIGFTSVKVPVEGYDETRGATDDAITAFREQVEAADPSVREAFADALTGLDQLDGIRDDIDASTAPKNPMNIRFASEVFERYTAVVQPFFAAASQVSLSVDGDAELRQGTELANLSARVIEVQSVMLAYALTDSYLSPGGIDQSAEISRISMLQSEFRDVTSKLKAPAGNFAAIAKRWYPTELTDGTNEQITTALTAGRIDLATAMGAVTTKPGEGFPAYESAIHRAVNDRADHLDHIADARRLRYGALALIALVSTIGLSLGVSRSITRPLRSLTEQAKNMANRGLPEAVLDVLETPLGEDVSVPKIAPITVKTRDEVADVAGALNTVQDSALDLAVEQAVLRRNIADSFTNLGRRNQNLLSRQLDFITELEANETNPDTLSALFRLDHLATRMRRNAESLLVLAGIGPPRRWAAPVAVVDVIRAAFGEVETYERAVVRDVEPALVMGSAAADLAHLLAELLENALTFSPPEEQVEVRGRRLDDGYTVAVIDAGFGMAEADLVQANRRLAGTEAFTVAPSKYLGHYVAGNLAARHGIQIKLSPAPGQGITALVILPSSLLAADTDAASPAGALSSGSAGLGSGGVGDAPFAGSRALWSGGGPGSPAAAAASALPPGPAPAAGADAGAAAGLRSPVSPPPWIGVSSPSSPAPEPLSPPAPAPAPWSSPPSAPADAAPAAWAADGSPSSAEAAPAPRAADGSRTSAPAPWSGASSSSESAPAAWAGDGLPSSPGAPWSGASSVPYEAAPAARAGDMSSPAAEAAVPWSSGGRDAPVPPWAAIEIPGGAAPSGGTPAGAGTRSWAQSPPVDASPGAGGPRPWAQSPPVDASPGADGPRPAGTAWAHPDASAEDGPVGGGWQPAPATPPGETSHMLESSPAYGRHRDYRAPATPFPSPATPAADYRPWSDSAAPRPSWSDGSDPAGGTGSSDAPWLPADGSPSSPRSPAAESGSWPAAGPPGGPATGDANPWPLAAGVTATGGPNVPMAAGPGHPPEAGPSARSDWAPPGSWPPPGGAAGGGGSPSRWQPAGAAQAGGGGVGTGPREPVGLANALDGVPSRPMWAALADLRPARPVTRRPGQVADPRSGGTTAAGLTRRVSGAQLPTMQPRAIRRADEEASGAALPVRRPQVPAEATRGPLTAEDSHAEAAAGHVYDFLSRFTAGVQRGLDESDEG